MASSSSEHCNASGIYGTTDITIKIENLKDSTKIVDDVFARPEIHARIQSIIINAEEPDELDEDGDVITTFGIEEHSGDEEDEDDDAKSVKSSGSATSDVPVHVRRAAAAVKRMQRLTDPITRLLDAVERAGGSLSEFTWAQENWWDSAGTRPQSFWPALWKHARTLQKLDLGFYTHEVHKTKAAEVAFPALKELYIDSTTAHGDDGAVIEHLFKSSPNLEVLCFEYPGCDLPTCQIQNITWDYTFPKLRVLKIGGYDFAPKAFAAFLTRCTSLETYYDNMDDYHENNNAPNALPPTALPKINALKKIGHATSRPLKEWFDPTSARRIRHLALIPRSQEGYYSWAASPSAQEIKVLEIDADVQIWRWSVPEIDSDDDEPERRRIEAMAKDAAEGKLTPNAITIQDLLVQLKNVQELGVGLESGNMSIWHGDGEGGGYYEDPTSINVADLRTVLRILPPNGKIRALRVWDSAADKLTEDDLADLGDVPRALEYLSWEGEEKILYRLEKRDGKVKAVPCEPLREVVGDAGADWTQGRILDY